jgi:hypothetical protein
MKQSFVLIENQADSALKLIGNIMMFIEVNRNSWLCHCAFTFWPMSYDGNGENFRQ